MLPGNRLFAERIDGSQTAYINNAHCPACARATLIEQYKGYVDLRGLFVYGRCYQHLSIVNGWSKELRYD